MSDASPFVTAISRRRRCPDSILFARLERAGSVMWLAINQTTHQVRVKVIPKAPFGPHDPAGREIESIKCLEENLRQQHANLVSIHHVGECDDQSSSSWNSRTTSPANQARPSRTMSPPAC